MKNYTTIYKYLFIISISLFTISCDPNEDNIELLVLGLSD